MASASSVMWIFVEDLSAAESGAAPAFGDLVFSSVDIRASLRGATLANPTKDLRAQEKSGLARQHASRTERRFAWITGREEEQQSSCERQDCNGCKRIAHSEN